ncbi:hypothetical protein [Streptomyces sp. NPDC002067]
MANRLANLAAAERTVVLDAGRITQQGTYEQLTEQESLFLDLPAGQIASDTVRGEDDRHEAPA